MSTSAATGAASCLLLSLPPIPKSEWMDVKRGLEQLPPATVNSGLSYDSVGDGAKLEKLVCLMDNNVVVGGGGGAIAEALRLEFQKQWGTKLQQPPPLSVRYSVVATSSVNEFNIRTYQEWMEPHKFMCGYWASEWILGCGGGSSSSSSKLLGKVNVHVHYFEDGKNIQYRVHREVPSAMFPAEGGGSKLNAAAVVQHITVTLEKLHEDLLQLSDEPVQASLKKIRRILPITKTRMKWDDAAQAQVRLLNSKDGTTKKKTGKLFVPPGMVPVLPKSPATPKGKN